MRSYGRVAKRLAVWGGKHIGMYAASRLGTAARKYMNVRRLAATGRKLATKSSLSYQVDQQTQYRRRRAPRRLRRRAQKFAKRVNSVINKGLGMRSWIVNNSSEVTWVPTSVSDGQAIVGVTMYGCEPDGNVGNGDLFRIAQDSGFLPGSTVNGSGKLKFRSCVLDVFIQNKDSVALYCDIYHVLCRKDHATYCDPGILLNQAVNISAHLANTNVVTNGNLLGVTPFDCPDFGSTYIIKRKQRILIPGDGNYNTQLRDAGDYEISVEDLSGSIAALSGKTEGLLIVFRSAELPAVVEGVEIPGAMHYKVSYTKNYHFSIISDNTEDRIGWDEN